MKMQEFAMQFTMKLPGHEKITYVNVTIDFEMQKSKPTEYKIVKRGIYYAASLLRDTLTHAGKYANIHKVYSVWLCNFEFIDSGRYVHKYNMFRNYIENNSQKCEKDPDADLLEVIFIELTKLAEHTQDELAQFLNAVFHDIGGLPKLMEEKSGVAIGGTALEKGVSEVIDMVKYGDIREVQGELRGEQRGEQRGEHKKAIETAINLIKMGILTLNQIAQSTGLTEEDIIEAKRSIAEEL
jgi:predicted transposase/invertase (TIGR01784 family)